MAFLSTVFLLAGVVSAILIALFVGHGLAAHDTGYVLAGLGAAVVAAGCLLVHSRLPVRGDGRESHH